MEILKVSSHSSPNSVAGAIAGVIREQKAVEVQAVGAGAANQAVKAIAIARGYLAPIGMIIESDIACADRCVELLREEMQGVYDMRVPLAVDVHQGKSWYDAKG